MRHAAKITDNCHLAVMSALPIETKETHIHAEFMYHALRQGAKKATTRSAAAVKHAQPYIGSKRRRHYPEKRSVLIDAGAEECYASDVTRCFPVNGDWAKEHGNLQLGVENAVCRLK